MQLEKKYYTVQDSETLKLMFQHIEESEIIAVDTETTGLNPRKDKICRNKTSAPFLIEVILSFEFIIIPNSYIKNNGIVKINP